MSRDPKVPDIVILGGGSAGWITACLLLKQWEGRGGSVTLIESPEIGIIGVGEGSTPQLKALLDHLDIAEVDWMAACDATYKLGIRFSGWSERAGFASYFHPFPGPVDLHSEPGFLYNCALARRGFAVSAHPDEWFLATLLAEQRKGPQPSANFPFPPSYGYHFDAHKLGGYLREWAAKRGIRHISATVAKVEHHENGEIATLITEGGEQISGDVFVDCSGFRALLAGEAIGGEFISFADNLFNDRAVVLPSAAQPNYHPQTESIAMKAGWRWSIPLKSRTGNGYVYSSRYISDEEAETELRAAIGVREGDAAARVLKMRVGRMAESWRGNVLAAGLAQGFIEPLEATALHIVIATALEFAESYERGGFSDAERDSFNVAIGQRYDAIRDYIAAHYRMNQRSDTAYWRDCAQNQALSDQLKAMMTAWFTHQDIAEANARAYPVQAYSSASWHCLFAGYGTFPPEAKMQPLPPEVHAASVEECQTILAACAENFAPVD